MSRGSFWAGVIFGGAAAGILHAETWPGTIAFAAICALIGAAYIAKVEDE